MKTPIRFSFLILTLGIFSSCAEQFTSRGEATKGFYTSRFSTTAAPSPTQKQRALLNNLKRDTVRYAHEKLTASTALEKTAFTERAHTNALKSSNSINPDILLGDSFGGNSITAVKSLTKVEKRLMSPHFSPNKRSGINKSHTYFNKEKGNSTKTKSRHNLISQYFPEAPGAYSSIWEWILYINFIVVLISSVIGGIYVFHMFYLFYINAYPISPWAIPFVLLAIAAAIYIPYNQIKEFENLENHSWFYQFAYWLLALSIMLFIVLMPIALTMWEDAYFMLIPIGTGGAGLMLYILAMFIDFLFFSY